MRLIDTHTHLDFEHFDADRHQVLTRCRQAGVERVVVLGVHAANWARVWQLACDEPTAYAALGLHPVFLQDHRPEHLDELRGWLARCVAKTSSAPSARSGWTTTSRTPTARPSTTGWTRSWRWPPSSSCRCCCTCAAPMRRCSPC